MNENVKSTRIVSIDALRGFDMFWLIGGTALIRAFPKVWDNDFAHMLNTQSQHVDWIGYHFQDLIMPLFLFIVGLVIPFSVLRRVEKGQSLGKTYLHLVRRWAVLLLCGLIMSGLLKFDFANMGYCGILQRIAWSYLFVSIIVLHTKPRYWAFIVSGILLAYWLAANYVPVPGFGAGVYTPEGCLHSWIDQNFLPGGFNKKFYGYGSAAGIMGTMNTVAICLAGATTGMWLKRQDKSGNVKTLMLLAAGIVITGIGAGLTLSGISPSIKMIWTSSYTIISLGLSLLLLSAFYWVIDVKRWKKWAFFFIVIGMNPLTIYLLQIPVSFNGIAKYFTVGIIAHSGMYKPLVIPITAMIIKWLLLYYLYVKKIFIRV